MWTFYLAQEETANLGPVTLRDTHERSTQVNKELKLLGELRSETHMHIQPKSRGNWKSCACHVQKPMQHSSPRRNVRLAVGGFLGVAPQVDLQPVKNQTDLPMPAFVSF